MSQFDVKTKCAYDDPNIDQYEASQFLVVEASSTD